MSSSLLSFFLHSLPSLPNPLIFPENVTHSIDEMLWSLVRSSNLYDKSTFFRRFEKGVESTRSLEAETAPRFSNLPAFYLVKMTRSRELLVRDHLNDRDERWRTITKTAFHLLKNCLLIWIQILCRTNLCFYCLYPSN
jgi:hypothetical protein